MYNETVKNDIAKTDRIRNLSDKNIKTDVVYFTVAQLKGACD